MACGHNIIAASAVGTALALADGHDELRPDGGADRPTPAEEAGGGKRCCSRRERSTTSRLRDAASRDHSTSPPPPVTGAVRVDGSVRRPYESHAAVAPYLGVNAADAAHLSRRWRLVYCVSTWRRRG